MDHKNSIITLGTFDGVHLGHQKIIKRLLEEADRLNLVPIVVTFFPHPTHILTPERPLKMINSIDERIDLLHKMGIKRVVVEEFTKEFANITATTFVKEKLIKKLGMKKLLVGYDHSFGKDKGGDFASLQILAEQWDFAIERINVFTKNSLTISSSLIRNLLLAGNVAQVNEYLGYEFCLFGKVVKGNQLGRKIGFNTANITLDYPNKIIPKTGVYVVKSTIGKRLYFGMMNIGYRPTIDGKKRTIEVHYFDLHQDLYNQKIRVQVLKRLRGEYKFDGLKALQKQLEEDKKQALAYKKSL